MNGWKKLHLRCTTGLWMTIFLLLHCTIQLKGYRNSNPEVFFEKRGLKKCSKFTGEHTCRSVISIKLLCFPLQLYSNHTYSSLNLLYIFKALFPKNTSGQLLLWIVKCPHNSRLKTSFYSLCNSNTAWNVSKYGVFTGPYFPACRLNTKRCGVFSPNAGKYGLEKTLYLKTFHAA